MFLRQVVSFFIVIGVMASGQTAHAAITGKVTNKTGSPVASAILTLVGKGIKDTSGADGTYSFVTTGVTGAASVRPHSTAMALNKGFLEFSLKDAAAVKVEIFDVNGNLLKKESRQTFPAGFYRLNVSEISRTSNLLVIHASIGQSSKTFRYVPLHNGTSMVNSTVDRSSGANGVRAKITADITDTIKVTATGFSPKAVPVTSYDAVMDIALDSAGAGPVTVQLAETKQVIRGFGINNTWGDIGNAISKCFDSTSGLGLNVLRVGMKPDTTVGAYQSFTDVKAAANLGCKYFIGTVWSAPKYFKTNNKEEQGGYLKEEFYEKWAKAIAKFPAVFKAGSGVDLYAMSPQNETDFASCAAKGPPCTVDYVTMLWTGKMYAKFFEIVGPLIKAAGCKAMAPEASEWIHAWSDFSGYGAEIPGQTTNLGSSDPLGCGYIGVDAQPKCTHDNGYDYGHWLYANKKAWDAIDIFSTHQYDTQVAEPWPSDVPRTNASGTIEVWQTEMSGVRYWPEQGTLSGTTCTCSSHIQNGVAVARWIHNALTVGEASAWCYWWWKQSGDNEGITCDGSTLTKRYYTMGNFSKYMRPGQKVVNITGTKSLPAKVLLVASKSDAGKVVIVAINETTAAQSIPITITGGTVPASFKPIVTADGSKNWSEGTAVTVTGGVLTAQLEAMSVTTFVSQ